ncbi:hypothetical protein JOC54_004100 [Alkalihalobacillus xiaoxiensis]|uniref:Uncharacterized protein n=1 Tax=Shouchella xiaoxiensis TaxID=766895 RepID=A0ABS2T2X5_9BACI|nr:hypothetical protein [Shouchella xiaoxiensis]MBM7840807.1 hypothetical protein [Shouchella xiaoxiensis]
MNRVKIGSWLLDIDVEKTATYYRQTKMIACTCEDCQHYVAQCPQFSNERTAFFHSLGIDPRKEGEVFIVMENDDGTDLYSCFYHIVGTIIKGPDDKQVMDTAADFRYYFTNELDLVPEDFPKPIVQVGMEMSLQKQGNVSL